MAPLGLAVARSEVVEDQALRLDDLPGLLLRPAQLLPLGPDKSMAGQAALAGGIVVAGFEQRRELDAATLGHTDEVVEAGELADETGQHVALDAAQLAAALVADEQHRAAQRQIGQHPGHLLLVEHVLGPFVPRHHIQRRLGDIDLALADELGHLPEEKSQQQRADVRTVHIRIRHDHDASVPKLADVEVLADTALERLDQDADLLEGEHLVDPRSLDVEDLPPQRQNRLGLVLAAALRRAAGGVALDDEQLRAIDVVGDAIGELLRHAPEIERALALDELPRLAGRLASLGGEDRPEANSACVGGILLEPGAKLLGHGSAHEALGFGIEQLLLHLVVELRLGQLDGHDGAEALPQIVAVGGEPLDQVVPFGVAVQGAGERGLEPGHVGSAVGIADGVRVGHEHLVGRVRVLHGDVAGDAGLLIAAVDADARAHDRLRAVEILHVAQDAVLEAKGVLAQLAGAIDPLVDEANGHPGVEVRQFAEAVLERLVAEIGVGEDLGVGQEADLRAGPPRVVLGGVGPLGEHVERLDDLPPGEGDQVHLAVLHDLDLGPF